MRAREGASLLMKMGPREGGKEVLPHCEEYDGGDEEHDADHTSYVREFTNASWSHILKQANSNTLVPPWSKK